MSFRNCTLIDDVKNHHPEFVKKFEVRSIISVSYAKQIVDELLITFDPASQQHGVIFIKDVSSAYELGTKLAVTMYS